jgi:long-subunit acyl-CoA synthetase (AMP-forming)
MNLTAQRNINIELYEAGNDELLMVGTMLDNDHLIKLEMTVYLPDEQITRSRLNMVRVPFPVCREVESVAERLVGLRIERGVLSEIVQRVGGRVGCSHIKELSTNIIYLAASYLVHRRVGVDPMSAELIRKPADEWFTMTKGLLRDSCLAYCQTTPHGLDERIGIQRIGTEHVNPLPLGEYESTLGVLLADRVSRWGDKTYFRWREGNKERSLSWKEFAAKVRAISRHLIAQGVGPRDRIAMISENRVEMYLFELAAMSIGAVSVPVFAGYPPPQIDYVLGHSRPKLVVVSGLHQLEKIDRERHPQIEGYFCMDFDAKCKKWGATDFAELTAKGGAKVKELDERVAAVGADDVCMVMYTSGTTGSPKGVCLTHRNLISQRKSISLLWDVDENDVLMAYLPWHHSFGGLYERLLSLYVGCEFCLDDSRGRDLDRLLSNWKAFKPTLFFSVPRVHDLLVTRCREDATAERVVFGDRLRFVMTAGALLPATVEAEYRKRDIPVVEGWGLTETAPCVTLTTTDQGWRSGYVGFPLPGISIRIADDQEILVKGPFVMAGYLDDEETTSRVLDVNGWFHSGDLGEFTKEGLRVLGRKDGAFKLTTGEKVHPQRVETALVNESPYIRMAVALGGGENCVAALIYPDMSRLREWATEQGLPTDGLTEHAAVRELFTAQIASVNAEIEVKYQRVRRAVLIDDEPTLANSELTPSGKLVRSAVIDHHKDTVAAVFATMPGQDIIEIDKQRELQKT